MFMLYGCGTTLYGRAKTEDGVGHIATKWFCLINIPVVPLKSFRVTEEEEGANLLVWHSTKYRLVPLEHLYRRHLMVWGITWGTFIVGMWALAKFGPQG